MAEGINSMNLRDVLKNIETWRRDGKAQATGEQE
jgi:hypothetical protein